MEDVIISGRHFDVSDDLKETIRAKTDRIAGEYNKLTTARIVMSVEKFRQKVEIQLEGKNLDLHAEAETNDMYASIDEAFDRIEVQLRKRLDRMQDHHVDKPVPESLLPPEPVAEEEDLEEDIDLGVEAR